MTVKKFERDDVDNWANIYQEPVLLLQRRSGNQRLEKLSQVVVQEGEHLTYAAWPERAQSRRNRRPLGAL